MAGQRKLSLFLCVLFLLLEPFPLMAGKADDTLVYAGRRKLVSLFPYQVSLREGLIVSYHVWDGLISRSPLDGSLQPLLAASWRWVGPTAIDFRLRKDVTFHNGDPLTARDVAFTVNYIASEKKSLAMPELYGWLESAEARGPYDVRINLVEPFPAALDYLAELVPILPRDYFEKTGLDGFNARPVGSGPYYIDSATPESGVRMTRYDAYYRNTAKTFPAIAHLEYKIMPDQKAQVEALGKGEIDWLWRAPRSSFPLLEASSDIQLLWEESMRVSFLTFGVGGGSPIGSPLNDVRVRQAIVMGLDRARLAQSLFAGPSRIMNGFCLPEQAMCQQGAIKTYPHDADAARRLMAEAGYGQGFETELCTYRDQTGEAEKIAGALQEIGVRAKVRVLFLSSEGAGGGERCDAGIVLRSWGSYGVFDASAFTGVFFKGGPEDMTRDPQTMEWLKQADSITNVKERESLYAKALERISEQAYGLPLYTHPVGYAFRKELDFHPSIDEMPRFNNASWR